MTSRVPQEIARAIDYTDVRKDVTYDDIERICLEARDHQVGSLVVPSALVRRAVTGLDGASVAVSCYVGYPFGTQAAVVKAREAAVALEQGATEIEVVPHYGAVRAGRWPAVEAELRAVQGGAEAATFKLVVETSYLSDDELSSVARVAADAGYTLIANTAGFRIVSTQPETEAAVTKETVKRLVRAGDGRIKPKAIGGVRTYADIACLLQAGASRIAVTAEAGLLRRLAEQAQENR